MRKSITLRTAERLIRAAYEYEHLAARLRSERHEREGNGIAAIASQLGNIGRALADKLKGEGE
jgi:hypothetical protein